jgi:hypothetical protein
VATVSGATLYTWTAPGTISGQGTKIIQVTYGSTPANNQQITCRTSNACGQSAIRTLGGITIQFCPARVGEGALTDLNAYPNPTNDVLNVDFSTDINQDYVITLTDATGRVAFSESNTATQGLNNLKIDVKGLTSGLYMLNFLMGDSNQTIRVFVE